MSKQVVITAWLEGGRVIIEPSENWCQLEHYNFETELWFEKDKTSWPAKPWKVTWWVSSWSETDRQAAMKALQGFLPRTIVLKHGVRFEVRESGLNLLDDEAYAIHDVEKNKIIAKVFLGRDSDDFAEVVQLKLLAESRADVIAAALEAARDLL